MNPERTVSDNGRRYTVTLDVGSLGDDVQHLWFTRRKVARAEVMQGVILGGYDVRVDNDPTFRAVVTIAAGIVVQGEPGGTMVRLPGEIYVSKVEIYGQPPGIVSTTLPIRKLLHACIRCGAVAGRVQPDGRYKLILGDDGRPVPPSKVKELAGEIRRPRQTTEERNREISRLLDEFRRLKAAGNLPKGIRNQPDYIVAKYGCAPGTVADYIKAANKWGKAQRSEPIDRTEGDTQ